MVGLNSANAFEGASGPVATTTSSAQRNNPTAASPPVFANTGNNAADFSLVTALGNTHTSGGANVTTTCPIPTSSATPASVAQGGTTTLTVSIAAGAPTGAGGAAGAPTALTVTADLTAFGGSATTAFTAPATVTATTASAYTYSLAVPAGQTVNAAYSIPVTITDKAGDITTSTIALAVTSSGGGGPTPTDSKRYRLGQPGECCPGQFDGAERCCDSRNESHEHRCCRQSEPDCLWRLCHSGSDAWHGEHL